MAFKCQNCGRVHPKGAVSCDQAREMIAKRGRDIDHRITHHKETHRGCSDPYNCVIREDHLAKAQARSKLMNMRF